VLPRTLGLLSRTLGLLSRIPDHPGPSLISLDLEHVIEQQRVLLQKGFRPRCAITPFPYGTACRLAPFRTFLGERQRELQGNRDFQLLERIRYLHCLGKRYTRASSQFESRLSQRAGHP
jgi:hypothetical protein